tara:strand:+ start:2523 stop:2933 length:411 start_codon:yes stop_codon:yes gene_type:complete
METENIHKIYFGHPISIYNTSKEAELITRIEQVFANYTVENPNQPHHTQGYQNFKISSGNGMLYYYQEVLPKMSAGIFLPFEDGMWGAGTFGEAEFLHELEREIYTIDLAGDILDATLDPSKKLSIEDTRARVYPQ